MAASKLFAEEEPDVYALAITSQFEALSDAEKHYAHWMSRASFEGTRIILRQNSADGEGIFDLIIALYHQCDGDWESLASAAGVNPEETRHFLEYASMFLSNLGNYASLNNRKIFPRISQSAFASLCACSPDVMQLFASVEEGIFSGSGPSLGYPDVQNEVSSNYYPGATSLGKDSVSQIQSLIEKQSIEVDNTRLERGLTDNGSVFYKVLVASEDIEAKEETQHISTKESENTLEISDLQVVYGDHSQNMRRVRQCLENASGFAANNIQLQMLDAHKTGFQTGSMIKQKEAQALWVQDRNPRVESLLGFIEYYRDPHGVRAEWRGFVLIENQAQTQLFTKLTQNSRQLIDLLPWNKNGRHDFETETFEAPEYNSMEALTFVSTSIPAGTNAPNHADVRREYGYKNFAIRNRIIDSPPGMVPFLSRSDSQLYSELSSESFGALVALHELFGHGSGQMLQETAPGVFNFDFDNPPYSPLSCAPITSWYHHGEDFRSVFGWSYEECRCELVGLYLALLPDTARLFPNPSNDRSWDELVYIMFLYLMKQGLAGLLAWTPSTNKWGSSHARARFAIAHHLIREGIGRIEYTDDTQTNLEITIKRDDLKDRGLEVISQILLPMHICICTADRAGLQLFDDLSHVSEKLEGYRPLVEKIAGRHKQMVQVNTVIEDNTVNVKTYEASPKGMIRSWAERDI